MTIDAIGCQKTIARKIVDGGGDYVLTVKGNRAALLEDIQATVEQALEGNLPKGDVMTTARIAGIQAAKRTSELIPMCHPLALSLVDVDCTPNERTPGVDVTSLVRCQGQTGAEMEALTAVAAAALTIIDMAKSADRCMTIEGITLIEKRGGKSGTQRRPKER